MMTRKIIKKKCKDCNKIFDDFENRKNDFCSIECGHNYKIKNKEYGRDYKPSYEYICRRLVSKNRSGDAYGITIPRELVEKYNLLHKKFKIEIKEKGIFIIKTKIEYVEIKDGK